VSVPYNFTVTAAKSKPKKNIDIDQSPDTKFMTF